MAEYKLANEQIVITIKSMGAELVSFIDRKTGLEYMWDGQPEFWKRTSPILFPVVGSLRDQKYKLQGREYPMSQHGFARDMEFKVLSQTQHEIWFCLQATEETLHLYPYLFQLEIGYLLQGRKVAVSWKVTNQDQKEIYFSIGGHPAFMCPIHKQTKQTDYFLRFDTMDRIESNIIGEQGLATNQFVTIPLEHGILSITETLFDQDALVVEHHQAHEVALLDQNKIPYLTVSFEAPLFGIWSPPKKNAPFICIEPWYGRCDSNEFEGEFTQREWGNQLQVGETFISTYHIEV